MTTGPDHEIWFTSSGSVKRIAKDGSARTYRSRTIRGANFSSITTGTDGALWFIRTASGEADSEQIVRLEPEGHMSRFAVDAKTAGPSELAAGGDGAMWVPRLQRVRDRSDHRGWDNPELSVKPGVSPNAITAAKDGALWFTAGSQIGRISTAGDTRLWPVKNANDLGDIVQDPDGSFWMTDSKANAVRHFEPPAERALRPSKHRPHDSAGASAAPIGVRSVTRITTRSCPIAGST